MPYARTNDDLWFWFMAVRNHYKILPVDNNLPAPCAVEGTRDADGLSEINDHGSMGFNADLQCLLEHYPEVDSALRRDYVLNDGTIKFGEMTFSSGNGNHPWHPQEQNLILGNLIKLPEKSPFPQEPRSLP